MKTLLAVLLMAVMMLALGGCGEGKTLTCDGCGTAVEADADSNADDSWQIYCDDCEEKLDLGVSFDDISLT